jgi:hypothetical protein
LDRDIIVLPESTWKMLHKWYGGGPVFPRKVVMNGNNPSIELYPPLITSILGNLLKSSLNSLTNLT